MPNVTPNSPLMSVGPGPQGLKQPDRLGHPELFGGHVGPLHLATGGDTEDEDGARASSLMIKNPVSTDHRMTVPAVARRRSQMLVPTCDASEAQPPTQLAAGTCWPPPLRRTFCDPLGSRAADETVPLSQAQPAAVKKCVIHCCKLTLHR